MRTEKAELTGNKMSGTGNEPGFEASIEITREEFEFAVPPMSKEFIIRTFQKYDLRQIVFFWGRYILCGTAGHGTLPSYVC